jgi:hypothetical protein
MKDLTTIQNLSYSFFPPERITVDDDIRENLKEVGKHLEDVGRQVASTKSNPESIVAMRDCLIDDANTLDTYLRIQSSRMGSSYKG